MVHWKEISGFPDYLVNNLGQLKGIKRVVASKKRSTGVNTRKISERNMSIDNSSRYGRVRLSCNGRTKSFLVHRLVAISFIPNPDNKPCVNHINGDKTDNRVENLEWVTYSENEIHSIKVLGKKFPPMSDINRAKISERLKNKPLSEQHKEKLRKPKSTTENFKKCPVKLSDGRIFESICDAARRTGTSQSSISNNLCGLSKTTKIGIWEYC